MNHLSLFNGIGGFQLAASWLGWNNVAHVEIDPFCNKVVAKHFPESQCFTDIKQFDGRQFKGSIDIISGGFPCQPYSNAGKRKGTDDDRHLWPEMLRVIREIQPSWVVGENVRGLTNWNGGLVFDQVQADLEAKGYEVLPFLLPACGVNAPHRRDRIWFVAKNTLHSGCVHGEPEQEGAEVREQWNTCTGDTVGVCLSEGATPDTPGNAITGQDGKSVEIEGTGIAVNEQIGGRQLQAVQYERLQDLSRDITDTDNKGCEWDRKFSEPEMEKSFGCGFGGWDNFPTQSPLCDRNDGLSDRLVNITFSKWRNESIKALGNAIVPQVAYELFKAINKYNEL